MKLYILFHQVLAALLRLHLTTVRQTTVDGPISAIIANNKKYASYFNDCLGALDGSHFDVSIRGENPAPYRNRKGRLSQDVLAVCNFELQFTYVLAGREGSAHDGRVLRDAVSRGGFKIPDGKYYLGDAGYSNSKTEIPDLADSSGV